MKLANYLFRTAITPLMIVLVVLPAYLLGWINGQASFIAFLLISGITGTIIQYAIEQWQKKRNGEIKEKEEEPEENNDPLSKLPQEVQDLIKEAELLHEEDKEGK